MGIVGFTARFEGGPWGGRTEFQPGHHLGAPIHAPVWIPRRFTSEEQAFPSPSQPSYGTEI